MSPEAQAYKFKLKVWGDPPVLKSKVLNNMGIKEFKLFKAIPEPHPTWLTAIEEEWNKRFGY